MSEGHNHIQAHEKPLTATDISRLIRDELDRNNQYLAFAQTQIEQDRKFYKHLYGWTALFLALMIAAAGVFQYSSVTQMRTDMKDALNAELERDKAEIAAVHAEASAATVEVKATVTQELANVRAEVQKRIDTEFKEDNIAARIQEAAKSLTQAKLEEIIRADTTSQVEKGLKAQEPLIQKAIEDHTRETVKELDPTIRASVDRATAEQVARSVAPIEGQMQGFSNVIRIGNLTILARGDDRKAFDYLFRVSVGTAPESTDLELKNLSTTTVGAIMEQKGSELHLSRSFLQPQTPESMKKLMFDQNTFTRITAIENYPENDKTVLPYLVTVVQNDANLTVVNLATRRFNGLTKQAFDFWQEEAIVQWWNAHKEEFQ